MYTSKLKQQKRKKKDNAEWGEWQPCNQASTVTHKAPPGRAHYLHDTDSHISQPHFTPHVPPEHLSFDSVQLHLISQ